MGQRRNGSLAPVPFMRKGAKVVPWVNPLVCVCREPMVNAMGECSMCRRKPLALFGVRP